MTKYKEEAIEHLFKDVENLKTQMEGFLKAFNSLKSNNTNKSEFPLIKNTNDLIFNQQINKPEKKNNMQNSLISSATKVNFEDKFYICVFQILLGDNIEYFFKKYDFNFFSDFNSVNNDVLKKIKENNSNILSSIFINIDN